MKILLPVFLPAVVFCKSELESWTVQVGHHPPGQNFNKNFHFNQNLNGTFPNIQHTFDGISLSGSFANIGEEMYKFSGTLSRHFNQTGDRAVYAKFGIQITDGDNGVFFHDKFDNSTKITNSTKTYYGYQNKNVDQPDGTLMNYLDLYPFNVVSTHDENTIKGYALGRPTYANATAYFTFRARPFGSVSTQRLFVKTISVTISLLTSCPLSSFFFVPKL